MMIEEITSIILPHIYHDRINRRLHLTVSMSSNHAYLCSVAILRGKFSLRYEEPIDDRLMNRYTVAGVDEVKSS